MNENAAFKSCACGSVWEEQESFIRDKDIDATGMTILPRNGTTKLYFFFNHEKCRSTLAISADDFADLIEEQIPQKVMAGEEECPGHCTNIESLEKCENECHNAPFRRLLLDRIKKKKI